MGDGPIDLDEYRGTTALLATEDRRRRRYVMRASYAVKDIGSVSRLGNAEFDALLGAEPAGSWREAAAKAQYLIRLFAVTPEARDPHRQALITQTMADLTRLSRHVETSS